MRVSWLIGRGLWVCHARGNLIGLSYLLLSISVDFGKGNLGRARKLGRELFVVWSDGLARSAPCCPEVGDDDGAAGEDLLEVGRRLNIYRLGHGEGYGRNGRGDGLFGRRIYSGRAVGEV